MMKLETFKKKFRAIAIIEIKAGAQVISEMPVAYSRATERAHELLTLSFSKELDDLLGTLIDDPELEMNINTESEITLRIKSRPTIGGKILRLIKKKDVRELLSSMYGIGRGTNVKNNPLVLDEDERKLFLNRFNHYLKYYELKTPLEIDTLAIACWNFVKMISEMNVSAEEPMRPLTNLRTFTNAYLAALKVLGITYLPAKRESAVSAGDEIDIGKLILDAADGFEGSDARGDPSKLERLKEKRKERESADSD